MYTGITQGCFSVVNTAQYAGHLHYQVRVDDGFATHISIGASVAVDGVCQTVKTIQHCAEAPGYTLLGFDAITETLNKTTLSDLHKNQQVSLERSARLGDEIGGHLLSGHVNGTATITHITQTDADYILQMQVPADWMHCIFSKGFIAIDGSSLTVVETQTSGLFTVHLIPETLNRTLLGKKQAGDRVNIELDQQTQIIVNTVERLLQTHSTAL